LLDPDSLTTRPLKGYQVRGREAQLMRLLEIQWLLMGNRLFVGDAWLYTPDGKAYHYKLDRPPPRQLGTDQRPQACRIMGRAGRGFVIDDRAGSQDSTPLLWYVEPREP
jgi:hypothetical protein